MARRTPLAGRIAADLLGLLILAACVFPVYWMVNTSLLPRRDIRSPDPTFLPLGGSLDNYRRVLDGDTFWNSLSISLMVAVATVVFALVFAFLAALAVSRFRFRGRRSFIITLLLIQMIPVEGLFISQYKMLEGLNLLNTVSGLTLVYVAGVLPFTIWTLRGFVAGVPYELEEAAMIDGCSRFGAFLRITFPLLAPGLVATGVFGFIQAWNEFTLAVVVMTREDKRTLPLWLSGFVDVNRGTDWGAIMAGSTLIAIPVVIFFLVVQGRMVAGLTAGAVKGMTLESLALRVLLASFPGTTVPSEVSGLLEHGLGGLCLFGTNTADGTERVAAYTASMRAAAPDAVVAIDEEGGDVTRLHTQEGSPVLGPFALGAVDDPAMTRATGAAIGHELAELGITLNLGPVADVNSNVDNPVIGTRSFGADPDLVAVHVGAWVAGLQSAGVAACAKHYPGHGDTAEDSHLALPVLEAGIDELALRELVPFAAAVAADVAAVMTSHIVVPAIDPALPATLSPAVLSVLRERIGFVGVVVTDALDMAGASAGRGVPEAAVLSIVAGADLLCMGPDKDAELVRATQAALVAAVRSGRLAEERLAEAAKRVGDLAPLASPQPILDPVALAGAAARSIEVEGDVPALTGARVVLVDSPGTIAVGDGPWGLPADLVLASGRPPRLPEAPLVVQVRDAHRQPGVGAVLAAVAQTGRPSVVIEWGWPGPTDSGLPRICARGWSRPGADAVLEVLRQAGWDR